MSPNTPHLTLVHPYQNYIKTAWEDVLFRVRSLLRTFKLFDEHKKLRRIECCAVRYQHQIELFAEIVHTILTKRNHGSREEPRYFLDTDEIRQKVLQVAILMQKKLDHTTTLELSFQATFLLADSIHTELDLLIKKLGPSQIIPIVKKVNPNPRIHVKLLH